MANICVDLLVEQFGFSPSRAKTLIQSLDTTKMRVEAQRGESLIRQELEAAIDDEINQATLDTLRAKRRQFRNLQSTADLFENMQRRLAANPKMKLRQVVEAEQVGAEKVELSHDSIALNARVESDVNVGKLYSELKANGIPEKFLRNISFSKSVARVLLGEPTDDKLATEAARIFREYMDKIYVLARSEGIDMGYHKNYLPQKWDPVKLAKVPVEEFIEDIKGVADLSAWINPDEVLKNIYHNLLRGFKLEDLITQRGIRSAFKGVALTKERIINIAEPENWMKIAEKYGEPDGIKSAISYLNNNYYNLGIVKSAGLNPERNLVKAAKLLMLDNADRAKELTQLNEAIEGSQFKRDRRLGRLWVNVDRSVHNPVDPSSYVYKTIQFMHWLQATSKLGGAAISAMADVYLMATQLNYSGIPLLEAYRKILMGVFTRASKAAGTPRQIAEYVGIYAENVGADIVNRFDPLYGLPGQLSNLQNKFFKWSGLTPWTNHMRSNIASILSHDLSKKVSGGYELLPKKFKKVLENFGINKSEFNTLNPYRIQAENGRWFMNFDAIEDEALRGKMYRFFVDQVEGGVLRPDAATMFYLNWGQQNGTVLGHIIRLGTQFKSFSITFGRKHLLPATREAFAGNYGYIANLLIGSMVWGYLALTAKDILFGKTPRDLSRWETWISSMMQGGGLGIYGDILFKKINRFGNDFFTTILGPTAAEAQRVVTWGINTFHGEPPSLDEVTKFALRNTPFINMWYTRGAMNYLFLNAFYEKLSPGRLRRYKRRMEEEYNQKYFIEPQVWE